MARSRLLRFASPGHNLDLGRLRGYVILSLALANLGAALAVGGGEPIRGAIATQALLAIAGTVLVLRPVQNPRLHERVPFVAIPIIVLAMAAAPPSLAPFGVAYLLLSCTFANVLLPPRHGALVTAWAVLGLAAWSLLAGRSVLADGLVGGGVLVVAALATRHIAGARRDALDEAHTARRSAEELSLRDPLTNLPNRRAFDAEMELRAVEGRLAGLLIVDVDHFKQVNDVHGHPAGDEVLVEVSRRLASALRRSDLPARLGGDEFAVLVDGPLTVEGLRRVADAVRGATSAFAAQTQVGYVRVTTSVGGALVPLDVPDARRVRAVRALADRALYEAKKSGRDRAVIDGERRAPSARRGRRRPRASGPRAA